MKRFVRVTIRVLGLPLTLTAAAMLYIVASVMAGFAWLYEDQRNMRNLLEVRQEAVDLLVKGTFK